MLAAHEGHAEVARFLLEKGAFVDFPNEVWTTLLLYLGAHVQVRYTVVCLYVCICASVCVCVRV